MICDFGPTIVDPLPGNLALNKNISASSYADPNVPEFAIDGNSSTYLAVSEAPPQSVEIDLGGVNQIDHAAVFFNDYDSILFDYIIELSTDRINYTTVTNITNNFDIENQIFFDPVDARYVRITMTNYDFEGVGVRINETEVYGSMTLCTGGEAGRDVCPLIFNPGQEDGDGDAVGDLCDNCLVDFNPDQIDSDSDGKGDACDLNLFLKAGVYDPLRENITISPNLTTTQETGYYLIQFYDNVTDNETIAFGSQGDFLGFVPDDAIIFRTNLTSSELRNYSFVRFADIFQPAYKLSKSLIKKFRNNELINESEFLLIDLTTFGNLSGVTLKIEEMGGTILFTGNTTLTANISETRIVNISFIPDVIYIEEFPEYSLFNDVAATITGVRDVWDNHGLTGKNQVVAVADTGLDTGNSATLHRDFRGRVIDTFGLSRGGIWNDSDGHGTHVAGSVLGDGTESHGRIRGMAFDADLVFQSLASNSNPLRATKLYGIPRDLNMLFQQAYNVGSDVRIHTNSWGDDDFDYSSRSKEIDEFLWNNKDMIILFAAGNAGSSAKDETLSSQANSKNALIVGASENLRRPSTYSDDINDLVNFSSKGLADESRIKPDVVAPGSYILSTRSSICIGGSDANDDGLRDDTNGDGVVNHFDCTAWGLPAPLVANPSFYFYKGGTSMATPITAGAVALVRQYYQDIWKHTPSGALMKATIIQGTQDMPATGHLHSSTTPIPNGWEGFGRINVTRSLFPSGLYSRVFFKEDEHTNQGDEINYLIRVSEEFPLAVTLVWTDYPSSTWAFDGALKNDLDLKVTSPSGVVFMGNYMNNGISIPNAQPENRDDRNNVEKIIFPNTEDGFYDITIKATDLDSFGFAWQQERDQDFAVVASQIRGVDSANATNVTHYFPAGSEIYAQAVGLPPNTDVDVLVVAHRDDFIYDQTRRINEEKGFKVLKRTDTIKTTEDGTLPDGTEIWDTTGMEEKIFESNGKFNLILNMNPVGDPRFDYKTDLVDYHKKVGLRVAVANSSKTLTSDFKDTFPFGNNVYIRGVGFEPDKKVDVYAVTDRNWNDGDTIADPVAEITDVTIDGAGSLKALVWDAPGRNDVGKYDIVIDVNGDGKYNKEIDVVDGLTTTGFSIICSDKGICGIIESVDSAGKSYEQFSKSQDIFVNLRVFSDKDISAKLYVVKGQLRHLAPLEDVSDNVETVDIARGQLATSLIKVWSGDGKPLGDYNLVLDVNGNDVYDEGVDIYDPNGFSIVRIIHSPRFAIDSEGGIHVVARGREAGYNTIIYAYIPPDNSYTIDQKHPELFDWSEDRSLANIKFKTIKKRKSATFRNPDIAVDSKGNAHIIFEHCANYCEFKWLEYYKVDREGNSLNSRLLSYHFGDFEDFRLSMPSIAVDPNTDEAVIATKIDIMYPDAFYWQYIYPDIWYRPQINFFPFGPIPIPYYTADVSVPLSFYGDSIQVAKLYWDDDNTRGSHSWPFYYSRFTNARREATSWMDWGGSYRRGDIWDYSTVDDHQTGSSPLHMFYYPKVDVDKDGNIHVVYLRSESKDDPGSPLRIFYSKQDSNGHAYSLPLMVSSTTPRRWYPGIDVDSKNRTHIVWQSGKDIHYALIDGGSIADQKIAGVLDDTMSARPVVSVDSRDNPHVVYLNRDSSGKETLYYKQGKMDDSGSVAFEPGPGLELLRTGDYTKDPYISNPMIDTNKLAKDIDWADKVYIGWVDTTQNTMEVKYKRSMPRTTIMIILDGLSAEFLNAHLDKMPNLKTLIENSPYMMSEATTTFPPTTFSSKASLLTSLYPKNHKIPGDAWNGDTEYNLMPPSGIVSDPNLIKDLLEQNDINTIYDYLSQPGKILNSNEVDYFKNLKNNDDDTDNDAPGLITVYIQGHTHGVAESVEDIDIAKIDSVIKSIVDRLEANYLLKDTIFVITSDHGLTNVPEDEEHSLSNTTLHDSNLKVFLNGGIAHVYLTGNSDILDEAQWLYTQTFSNVNSSYYGAIDQILVKMDSKYYYYQGGGSTTPVTEETITNLISKNSGDIILISNMDDGYYFQTKRKAVYGSRKDMIVPLIFGGPGFSYMSRGNNNPDFGISGEDIGVTVAYFVGGPKALELMKSSVDGRNFYSPEFTITVGSPVDLHLYDSKGRHTGPKDGKIETQISSSDYRVFDKSGGKEITLLQAPDDYLIEVVAYDAGEFHLELKKDTKKEKFTVAYPAIRIVNHSIAKVYTNSSTFDMEFDLEGDGKSDMTVAPSYQMVGSEDESSSSAVFDITVLKGEHVSIDASRSTGVIIEGTALANITGGRAEIKRIFDPSLDALDFYTLGSYVNVSLSDNLILNLGSAKITLSYPNYLLKSQNLAESSLSIYKMDMGTGGWARLSSQLNGTLDRLSTTLNGSGNYIAASSDLVPVIQDIAIQPNKTNIVNASVKVSVHVTDNGGISRVTATLRDTVDMVFNDSLGLYQVTLEGPDVNGTYPVIIEAFDDNNNMAVKRGSFTLDLVPPRITIISPTNITYTVNNLNLTYYVDESSNQGFILDGGNLTPLQSSEPFSTATILLTNLLSGAHVVTVYAIDELGNKGEASAAFDVAKQNIRLSNLLAPVHEKPGRLIPIKVTASNTMVRPEENVKIDFLLNGAVKDSVLINISGETSQEITFYWNTTPGRYELEVRAVPLLDEPVVFDNNLSTDVLITDKIPVLLVDDDNYVSSEIYTDAILSAVSAGSPGYDYVLWDTQSSSTPKTELLNKFPLVVWFSDGALSLTEQNNLKDHLDNGGYLLITGSRLGSTVGTSKFYKDYLLAQYMVTSRSLTIEGVKGDMIGRGLLFEITDSGEEVQPQSSASTSLRYSGGGSAMIKVDSGIYKAAYITFGLHSIADNVTRNILLNRALEWFDIDTTPPVISNLRPRPGESFPINTSSVVISFNTDERAECRYSRYSSMYEDFSNMSPTNETGILHSVLLTNLSNGVNYTYFITCIDTRKNYANALVSFNIHNRTFIAPEFNVNDLVINENETLKIVVDAVDPENDTLSYSILDVATYPFIPIAARFNLENNTFIFTPNFEDSGTYKLKINVSDPHNSTSKTFTLRILDMNRPPVLPFIGPKVILEDTYFYYDVNATDPDGDQITYHDNTSLFNINPYTGVISFNVKNEHVGNYSVNISVTDGRLTIYEIVKLRITNVDDAPRLEFIPVLRTTEGLPFNYSVTAIDPDGDAISFFANTLLFNMTPGGVISFTPTNWDVGVHTVNITVTDGLKSDSQIVYIVVEDVKLPPIVGPISNITVIPGDSFELNLTACDPDLDLECG